MMPLSFQSDFLSKYNKVLSEANKINEDVFSISKNKKSRRNTITRSCRKKNKINNFKSSNKKLSDGNADLTRD